MVYLALHNGTSPARKQDIATAEGISGDYVEQILIKLRTSGLVKSHRGARGGFSIARDPAALSVKEVLETVEGPISLAPCAIERCQRISVCVTSAVWAQAGQALREVFGRTTIGMLAEQARALTPGGSMSFEI